MIDAAEKMRLRFMAKVQERENGCWAWTGAIIKDLGYGRFGMPGNTVDYAHRAAWRIFRGPIPAGLLVCHRCDVRECVNPAHLFLGTNTDNMRDAANKGRISVPRANYASDETHQVAKLTNEQVLLIRATEGGTVRLARDFGVSRQAIWAARNRHSFKDVA